MPTVADLRVKFSADVGGAITGIRKVDDSIRHLAAGARSALGGLDFGQMLNVAGGNIIASGIRNITSSLVDLGGQALFIYSDYERLTMSLETFAAQELINAGAANSMSEALAMSGERAQEVLSWIEKLAVQSPFESKDISAAFRLAQAYGFTGDQAMRLTQATVDFAAGAGISGAMMDRITLALGQIQARGKVSAQELNQLSEAGINARGILAKAFNVSTASIMEMIEKGLVPADLAIEAITQSLEKDFGGAAKRQANTFSGLISSLSDLKSIGLREFFRGTFEAVQPLLQEFVGYVTDPAVKETLRGWGDTLGQYVAEKLEYVRELFGLVSQAATSGGGLFAALGSLTGGEVQITAEGLITSVNWGDFIGTLDWKNYVASLQWGSFVSTFAWRDAVTSLRWGDFVLAFDWNDWVGTFVWGDFVSIVNWADWIYTLSWGDFLLNLDWGNWVFSLQWGDWVGQLAWSDFVNLFDWTDYAVGLNWGDFVGSFNWADKVLSLQWGDYIGVFSWEKWVATIKWGDYVYRLAWSDFVAGITWSDYVLTLNWGDFLFYVDWNNWIVTLVWGDFMSVADWSNWIYTLTWGDYVFQLDWSSYLPTFTSWSNYISSLTWTDIVTAFTDWSTYVSKLTWTDIVVKLLDWATWIPALAWNEFVHAIDWATWVIPMIWNDYISQFSWSDFVESTLSWGEYIASINWGEYITEALDWSAYVASVTWENFVAKLEWPQFVKGINLSDWIPTFPGWSSFFGGSSIFGSGFGGFGGNANGTSYWRGGPTWVDERGPELFHFPSGEWAFGSDKGAHLVNLPRGTEIYSHENAMRMMGGAAANFGKSDKLTWIGANADGTTNPPTVWPGGGSSFAPNYNQRLADFGGKFQQAGDKVATKIQRQMEAAAKKHRQELESALESVPGLFGTSPVTQQQMDLAALGIPQNFADDWIRRLTDEVVNGVDWAGVDIKDAAIRAGLDPSLPAKAILELVKQQWNDSSFFAGGKNTDLINQEAVQKALQRQADAASGKAALMNLFGITPEQATGQAVALGTSMRSGIEQGLTQPTAGGGSDLLGSLTEVTPEQMAPIGAGIVNGLTVEIGKTEYADKIGAAFTKLFTGFLEKKEALTDVGSQIMTRITESLGNVAGLDMVGKFASAFRAQLALPDAITTLHDVGARILELVYQGYVDAAKEKDWPKATVTTNTVNPPPATGTPQGRSALALAGAGAGGPTVNVYATVASGVDIHQVAYQVADIIQKRSRR